MDKCMLRGCKARVGAGVVVQCRGCWVVGMVGVGEVIGVWRGGCRGWLWGWGGERWEVLYRSPQDGWG